MTACLQVYGALLWSMGKVFRGAEVTRVYVGSFRDQPPAHQELTGVFDRDKKELLSRIDELPKVRCRLVISY
jgi:EH domain-containing protein 1